MPYTQAGSLTAVDVMALISNQMSQNIGYGYLSKP